MPINEWSDDIIIAEMSDEPIFSEEMEALQARLEKLDGPCPDVILDAQSVSYLNSSNIAQLLRLRKTLSDRSARLRVCGLNEQTLSVIVVTGLDTLFEFTSDVATSLASLQMSTS